MSNAIFRNIADQFQILGGLAVAPRDVTAEEHAAFQEHARELMVRNAVKIAATLALLALVWWPLDPIVFSAYPEAIGAFARYRLTVAVCLVGVFWLARTTGLMQRRPEAVVFTGMLAGVAVSSHTMGLLASLPGATGSMPWFPFLFIGPYFTIFALFPLVSRIVLMLLTLLAILGGFFVAAPEALSSPFLPTSVSYLGFVALMAFGIGHAVYALTLASFVHRERTAASEAQIRQMNDSLESTVARQTEALRALAQHAEGLREEERGWMAHEIHDGLGQELTALRYAISFAQIQASQGGNSVGALHEVERLLGRTNDTMRHIISTLRPRVLDDLGIGPALRWLAAETTKANGIPCHVVLSEENPQVDARVSLALFRITQEALTNVLRHSNGQMAEVELQVQADAVVLSVTDDGVGLPADASGGHRTMGMLGIQERALALGGRAEWRSRTGGGTVLEVELPRQESNR